MTNLEFYKEEIEETIKVSNCNLYDVMLELYLKLNNLTRISSSGIGVLNWLCEEHQILAKEEKEYLSNVIEPFRNKIINISKYCENPVKDAEYIEIRYASIHGNIRQVTLPEFDVGTMFKGMKLNKLYTLAELGLEKVEVKEYDY